MLGTLHRPVSVINDSDIKDAHAMQRELEESLEGEFSQGKKMKIILHFPSGKSTELSNGLKEAVIDLLMAITEGRSITFEKIPQELSTFEASRKLGVSRPTLMKMIRDGDIPAHKVGSHHRLKTKDVFDFMEKRIQKQKKALDELLELEGALDI